MFASTLAHFASYPKCSITFSFSHSLAASPALLLAVLAWIVKTNLSCKHTRVELLTMDINEIWNYAPFVFAVLHGCGCWLFSKDFRRLPMDSLRLRCVCLVRVNELIPLRAALDFVIDYFFVYCWIQRFGWQEEREIVRVNWISLETAALLSPHLGFNHQKLLHLFSPFNSHVIDEFSGNLFSFNLTPRSLFSLDVGSRLTKTSVNFPRFSPPSSSQHSASSSNYHRLLNLNSAAQSLI